MTNLLALAPGALAEYQEWLKIIKQRVSSARLRQTFPEIGGLSPKNLRYCRAFFRFYCAPAIWQQVVAKLPDTPLIGVDNITTYWRLQHA